MYKAGTGSESLYLESEIGFWGCWRGASVFGAGLVAVLLVDKTCLQHTESLHSMWHFVIDKALDFTFLSLDYAFHNGSFEIFTGRGAGQGMHSL
jgi:hypothetical protein